MKVTSKSIFITIATAVLILIMGFTKLKSEKFHIEILQNGHALTIVDNVVELEKKEFKIRITLIDHDGVFMSSSFQRGYFDLKEGEEIKDYKWLNSKTRVE